MSLFKNWKLKKKEVKLVEDNKKLKFHALAIKRINFFL